MMYISVCLCVFVVHGVRGEWGGKEEGFTYSHSIMVVKSHCHYDF